MKPIEFKDIAVLVPDSLTVATLITPRAAENTGHFTFSNSDLKLKELEIVVLSCGKKVLDIPPYFSNTEFTILNCVVTSPEFLESYGDFATELCELRLVGKSKDVFSRSIGNLARLKVVESMRANKLYDASTMFPFVAKMQMVSEINKDRKRYFSVKTEISDIATLKSKNLEAIDWGYMCTIERALQAETSLRNLPDADVDY
jgi:hypothetical protein